MTATGTDRVVWVDLSTSDLEGAIHFYEKMFAWHYDEYDSDMGAYFAARTGSGEAGGMMGQAAEQAEAGVPPAWTAFVGCERLEPVLTRVKELGGSVLQAPMPIPGDARIAVIADPAGAVIALGEGDLAQQPILRDEPGAPVWVECLTRDAAGSRRFWEELFGWKGEEGPGGYVVFTRDGERMGGLMAMPDTVPAEAPSHWLVYFAADAAASCDRAVALGGTVLVPAHEVDEGRFAVIADPAGATFAVWESPPAT